ncbi:MAG: hypothetical protein LIO91_10025 [Bacteroidales bacterium]|nr:hypothetical protein [Bacteroidales bacterium]
MIKLAPSSVRFTENPHGYTTSDGKPLSGVTGLIHAALHLGEYPDATDYVRDFCIPRAAEYGTSVHHAIEEWDTMGMKVTSHPKSPRFIDATHPGPTWEVDRELETYIRHQRGYTPVANEYTVSDNIRYASNIDNVWLKNDTQGVWLIDTKTNNLKYYPGGVPALKEYLSWQLSVYAVLFERQNPELKVEGLACNWLRQDEGEFWVIDRKPDALVDILLSTIWLRDDLTGEFDYFPPENIAECFGSNLARRPAAQLVTQQIIDGIVSIKTELETAKTRYDELTATLRAAMERNDIKSWDAGVFRATIAADSTTTTLDTAAFKKAHPDLYKQFTKQSTRKGGFTIKLRETN